MARQVIVDLESAVKELVENALDASATSIEIRLKDSGLDSFEVQDNGTGIALKDHQSIALRGHTSKLDSFDALERVTTFGFRGEALASLCNLAKVTVATATTEDAPMGYNLAFDDQGKLLSTTREAKTRGTTVTVTQLFERVPVRRKDFERNIKKQFKKVIELVQAYALISQKVRISLTNWEKGKRLPLLLSTGESMSKTFNALFGSKAFASLTPLDLDFVFEPERPVLKATESGAATTRLQISGFISKPQRGEGRPSTDRQFYFLNGRPFQPTKLPRAFNEVYRSMNPNQSPCVVANFRVATGARHVLSLSSDPKMCIDAYDVNLSPDKRTIFMHSEANLVEALKVNLEEALSPFKSTYSAQSALSKQIGLTQPVMVPQVRPLTPPLSVSPPQRRSPSPASDEIDLETPPIPLSDAQETMDLSIRPATPTSPYERPKSVAISLEPRQLTLDTSGASWALRDDSTSAQQPPKKKRKVSADGAPTKRAAFSGIVRSFAAEGTQAALELRLAEPSLSDEEDAIDQLDEGEDSGGVDQDRMDDDGVEAEKSSPALQDRIFRQSSSDQEEVEAAGSEPESALDVGVPHSMAEPLMSPPNGTQLQRTLSEEELLDAHLSKLTREGSHIALDDSVFDPVLSHSLYFDMDQIQLAWSKPSKALASSANVQPEHQEDPLEVELAGLSVDDSQAEAALSRIVSQDDFTSMTVVGQFNLG